nr:hypothetical protein CFP56_57465 [Quercus suber]
MRGFSEFSNGYSRLKNGIDFWDCKTSPGHVTLTLDVTLTAESSSIQNGGEINRKVEDKFLKPLVTVFDRSSEPNHILIDVSEQQSPGTVSLVKPSMTSTSSSSSQLYRRARCHTTDAEMVNKQMNPEIDGEVEMEELETELYLETLYKKPP